MCGICGFVDYKNRAQKDLIKNMSESLRHRGPDDMGYELYSKDNFSLGLGHVRLSILDLSEAGHQPMKYLRYTIVYNGEIYNFKEIRQILRGKNHSFTSDCDTEVILHAFAEWNTRCVEYFIGMYAFAIYDRELNKLYLCRDRTGVKPLYYYHTVDSFAFASELKAFSKLSFFDKQINNASLFSFFEVGYIPKMQCIFQNTFKLEAGHWVEYNLNTRKFTLHKYWDVASFYDKPKMNISYEDAKVEVKKLFISAFNYRLISDVPVGIFLSGGYDSALVTSIISKELNLRPRTFTIGFHEGNNEAPYAEDIANILGTEHISYYCSENDALNLIPNLSYYYDEPFSDSSAIPTVLVSNLAKEKVSVVLSADGGDEIFGGYNSYNELNRQYRKISSIPKCLRGGASFIANALANYIPTKNINLLHRFDCLSRIFKKELDYKSFVIEKYSFPKLLREKVYSTLEPVNFYALFSDMESRKNSLEFAMLFDYKTYLADDILVKVDRATMSASLEGREPLLDHRIIEFVAQLPLEYKYTDRIKKRILKDIVHQYLPAKLMDRPKTGFTVPIYDWLRNKLKDYCLDTLSSDRLKETGLYSSNVDKVIDMFMKNKLKGYDLIIWRLLQYQSWYNLWMK